MAHKTHSFWNKGHAGGVVLFAFALLSIVLMNSPLQQGFMDVLNTELGLPPLRLKLYEWVKEGLMAVFFLYVSLELKREMVAGVLARPMHAALPIAAAIGGMLAPALVYAFLNLDTPFMQGWAIPVATDIAFALGVLSLLGKRASPSLKAFVLALAIVDDLGAMLIIAFGFTNDIHPQALAFAIAIVCAMLLVGRMGVRRLEFFWVMGACLWVVMLHSGVHATVAGVLTALTIPLKKGTSQSMEHQPLVVAEHALKPWAQFFIMPLFALCFAGIDFGSLSLTSLGHPLSLGILAGLFLGKPLGILAACALFRHMSGVKLDIGWAQIAGAGFLAGIGFTMSLFIGGLAFSDPAMGEMIRLGVYGGSILAGCAGYAVLRISQRSGQE